MAVLVLVPIVLGFTFYIFDHSLGQQLLLSLLVLVHLAVFILLQVLVHATAVHYFSALVPPTLFFIFGMLAQVLVFEGFYGWAMSWRDRDPRQPRRQGAAMSARDVVAIGLWIVVTIMVIYTIRHYLFTLNRVFGHHRQPYVDIGVADWPRIAVFVPCHDEERVIGGMLEALLASDYPADRYHIVPINDRSTDGTTNAAVGLSLGLEYIHPTHAFSDGGQ